MSKELFSSYQEDLAFAKELNILRNDFYYQMIESQNKSVLVDFIYKPLDRLSGDAYSARRVDANRTFYLLVDGMGKGISAAFTTVIMTSFVNHLIDRMIEHDSFSLDLVVQESIKFIQPILLEEEVLAIDYICFDNYFGVLEYAKFAMPPFLLEDRQKRIVRIKSNNPPLSKWQQEYRVDRYNVQEIEKFLFYSDGVVENETTTKKSPYATFIEDDFRCSFTREEFKERFFSKIAKQEDDITLIFINSLDMSQERLLAKKKFATTLENVEQAIEWYEDTLKKSTVSTKELQKMGTVFNELFMNAYEHGNLGLSNEQKHRYLYEDIYFEKLRELEEGCSKAIHVSVYHSKDDASEYIVTKICDEGSGFDTQILSQIFRNSEKFNGRGVFVSRKNSLGIYYNPEGNCVLFLNKL